MKILQLAYSLGNGGAEKFVVELSNELAKEHDVVLCTFKPNETWMLPPKALNAKVRNISLNTGSKKDMSNWSRAYKLIKKERPDVVHVHASLIAFYMLLFPLFFRNIRFIHTIHSTISPAYLKLFRLFSILSFAGKEWTNVCISKYIFEEYFQRYRLLSFVQIDNGICHLSGLAEFNKTESVISEIRKNKSATLLVSIGNYTDVKRFDMLVEVMNYFYDQKFPLYLLLLGEDKSSCQLNYHRVMQLKNKNVHVLGLKQNVADYIAASDALILSSSLEGMPLVILEAMSLGKPVISTPAGGVVDLIQNGVNGFIATDLSKEALITSVTEFLNAPSGKIEQIGLNNLETFQKKYSISISASKYLNIYQRN